MRLLVGALGRELGLDSRFLLANGISDALDVFWVVSYGFSPQISPLFI